MRYLSKKKKAMREKPANVDTYIAGFPAEIKERLELIRSRIQKLAPKAEEVISYGIPCYRMNDVYLIYFAGYKKHVSIYPAPVREALFKKEFAAYKTSRGTIQFPMDQPLPITLITKIIRFMIGKNKERAEERKTKAKSSGR